MNYLIKILFVVTCIFAIAEFVINPLSFVKSLVAVGIVGVLLKSA